MLSSFTLASQSNEHTIDHCAGPAVELVLFSSAWTEVNSFPVT